MVNDLAKRETTDISAKDQTAAIATANIERSIAEVQGAMTVAKRFPRDEVKARDRILTACARPSLAERAIYTYSRGGTEISGLTIRAAEEIARNWGNINFGWHVIESNLGKSTIEAFARDLETNTRTTRQFDVSHQRVTKTKTTLLTDPRDIYEKQANEAARRMRSCIEALIPRDIQDDAREQCEETLRTKTDVTPAAIKKLIAAFAEHGVTQQQIEKRIQRSLGAIQPAHVVQLRKIYNSMRDGMSDKTSWFDEPKAQEEMQNGSGVKALKNKLQTSVPGLFVAEPEIDPNTGEVIPASAGVSAKDRATDNSEPGLFPNE